MEKRGNSSADALKREARIKSRRERVEERKASKASNNNNNSDGTQPSGNNKSSSFSNQSGGSSTAQQQIADSLNLLDRRKLDGISAVTSIRVEADAAENARRIAEEETRASRMDRLQQEAIESGKINAAIEMRWSELLDLNMPAELHDALCSQKSECASIMDSKTKLITEFKNQMKAKDEEFVSSLKKQETDVDALIDRMSLQFKQMREEYEMELKTIEQSFLAERDNLLSTNKSEIDSLFEARRSMELAYMDARTARDEAYALEIEALRVKDAEDYNKLKIKLETDIQTLEQQLEEMRATYQLNTEKLEYNYRVLTERDMENSATLAQQKKKLTRLKETLSSLVSRYNTTDARDRHQNLELTEEYRRLTKQYKDLQAKFRHFEIADHSRYDEVWNMHVDEVRSIISKLLTADKVIHQQQLGLQWRAPSVSLDTTEGVDTILSVIRSSSSTTASTSNTSSVKSEISGKKLRVMLELISSEAGFLLDQKVKTALSRIASEEEKQVVVADSILRSLSLTSEKEVADLLSYFFEQDTVVAGNLKKKIVENLTVKIQPNDVIKTIATFMSEKKASTNTTSSNNIVATTTKNSNQERQEKQFWNTMKTVLPEKSSRVWTALEAGLVKYNNVLESRANIRNSISDLKSQNEQLKTLLRQYLGSEVNDALIIPPSQTIRVHTQE